LYRLNLDLLCLKHLLHIDLIASILYDLCYEKSINKGLKMLKIYRFFLIIIFCIANTNIYSQTANDFIKTQYGFYYWFGALKYQLDTCNLPYPTNKIDFLAAQAGVTKKMVANEGANAVKEGYDEARALGLKNGLDAMCKQAKDSLDRLVR